MACLSDDYKPDFSVIPPEVKIEIFRLLALKEKKACRLVCEAWRDIIDDSLKFKAVLNDENVTNVVNCYQPFELLKVENLTRPLNLSRLRTTFTVQVGCLVLDCRKISVDNLKKIFTYFDQTKKLVLSMNALVNFPEPALLKNAKFENLTILQISYQVFDKKQSTALQMILRHIKLPKLVTCFLDLELSDLKFPYPRAYYFDEYCAGFMFLANHCSTLKEFAWRSPVTIGPFPVKTKKSFIVPLELKKFVCEKLYLLKLNWLDYTITDIEKEEGPFNLGVELLKSQRNLSNLMVHHRVLSSAKELISNSFETLEQFWITSDGPARIFDCRWLLGCKKLKKLGICCCPNIRVLNFNSLSPKLEELCLSMTLNSSDIHWISKNLIELKSLWLVEAAPRTSQDRIVFGIRELLMCLKMDKLKAIYCMCGIDIKSIQAFCHYKPGLRFITRQAFIEPHPVTPKYSIMINREIYNPQVWRPFPKN